MSFTPIIPLSGIGGWRFLERTLDAQRETFASGAQNAREIQYFKDNIAAADTAEKLVADRTLLKVALGAFGLGDEIDKKAFIRTALDEGTEASDALAVRLVDPKYREMSAFFGYGNEGGARVGLPGFGEAIESRYRIRAFEEAVGVVDDTMRLALNFDRRIQEIGAATTSANDTLWFRVLGDPPMRAVIEGALGLPSSFGQLDLDQQLSAVKERAQSQFGADQVSELVGAEKRDLVIRRFLIRQQIENGPDQFAAGMSALTLLQNGTGPNATLNLLLSNG